MKGIRIKRVVALGLSAALTVLAMTGSAGAGPLAIQPVLDMQGQGLSIAEGGVGLEGLGAGTRNLSITVGGPVEKAFLYWAGRQLSGCPQGACFKAPNVEPFADQELTFDGNALTGTIAGTEDADQGNIAYVADVTSIVAAKGAGSQTFPISDGNLAKNLTRLNGAGLIVLYTDPSDSGFYHVTIADGLDFAFGEASVPIPFPFADNVVTSPVNLAYASSASIRTGELTLFVGDAEAPRPDRIDISDNPSLFNQLDASDGDAWDTDTFSISIPALSNQTTVQLVSAPVGTPDPDSLLWVLAGLRVPVPAGFQGCTPGYWKNHLSAWSATGFNPGQTVGSVFAMPGSLSSLSGKTLQEALKFGGGPGVLGGGKILLKASVAGLLNAGQGSLNYPQTVGQMTTAVNAALASNNRGTMLTLAAQLDSDNNLGCPLN
jgi:hypothetical protein